MNDRGARGEEYERKAEVTVEGGVILGLALITNIVRRLGYLYSP